MLDQRGPRWLNLVEGLEARTGIAQASDAANLIAERLDHAYPQSNRGRQWLTESVILALAGASFGVLLAVWGAPALTQLGIPPEVDLTVTRRLLLFAMGAAFVPHSRDCICAQRATTSSRARSATSA